MKLLSTDFTSPVIKYQVTCITERADNALVNWTKNADPLIPGPNITMAQNATGSEELDIKENFLTVMSTEHESVNFSCGTIHNGKEYTSSIIIQGNKLYKKYKK